MPSWKRKILQGPHAKRKMCKQQVTHGQTCSGPGNSCFKWVPMQRCNVKSSRHLDSSFKTRHGKRQNEMPKGPWILQWLETGFGASARTWPYALAGPPPVSHHHSSLPPMCPAITISPRHPKTRRFQHVATIFLIYHRAALSLSFKNTALITRMAANLGVQFDDKETHSRHRMASLCSWSQHLQQQLGEMHQVQRTAPNRQTGRTMYGANEESQANDMKPNLVRHIPSTKLLPECQWHWSPEQETQPRQTNCINKRKTPAAQRNNAMYAIALELHAKGCNTCWTLENYMQM